MNLSASSVAAVLIGSATLAACTSAPADASPGFRAACTFDYRPGNLNSQGGTQMMINGEVYVGCGGGPTIHLADVDGDTVTFARKADQVRVAAGGTEQVGPYRVHVVDVRGERVEFEMSRPNT